MMGWPAGTKVRWSRSTARPVAFVPQDAWRTVALVRRGGRPADAPGHVGQAMRTRRVMWPLLSQNVVLPARYGSSGARWTLPLASIARRDRVLARGRRIPVDGPVDPGVLAPLAVGERRGLPGLVVDVHLHPSDRCPPGGAHDAIAVGQPRHLRRREFEPVACDRGEGPDDLSAPHFFADRKVVRRHERPPGRHLDARQPLHVGHPVPAQRN